ncbi:adenylate kinase family protein [Candidatus Woesearchaeota archaeon]|nr:adenylate kinase family protein [Candidatus Woesearchaeota archaeon]
MKVIIITGTPGAGKSTLAKKLAQELKFQRVDLHKYYKVISTGYNKKKQSYDIDIKKFTRLIKEKAKTRNIIVDSHIAQLLPKSMVDLCIALTCSDLKKLKRRLQNRNYSKKKIRENLDAEIFQVCLQEARERGHKIIIVDACKDINLKLIHKIVRDINNA